MRRHIAILRECEVYWREVADGLGTAARARGLNLITGQSQEERSAFQAIAGAHEVADSFAAGAAQLEDKMAIIALFDEAPPRPDILDLQMPDNDAGADTVREYLWELLTRLWTLKDEFSGKRPFGESAWEYHLYKALGRAGLIRYIEDDMGYVEDVDQQAGDALIERAIDALLKP